MERRTRRLAPCLAGVGLLLGAASRAGPAGDVVINEIMYHPLQGAEYIELYNPTDRAIDLAGYRFTNGVGLDLGAGVVLAPEGYLVVCRSPESFHRVYGARARCAADYAGKLGNHGERLTLARPAAEGRQVVDDLRYDVGGAWPADAAGQGSSLELRDPALDNARPESWAASRGRGTPGAPNSVAAPSPGPGPRAPSP
jgi:hypothetical protein